MIVDGAKIALDSTPDLLPKLKEAGVVDAGGKGWLCVLEGIYSYLTTGKIVPEEDVNSTESADEFVAVEAEEITFGYCTEFLIEKTNKSAAA